MTIPDEDDSDEEDPEAAVDEEEVLERMAELEPDDLPDDGYLDMGYDEVKGWFEACLAQWRTAYLPSSFITCDETMVYWVGMSSIKLMLLPRKPTPLGVMFKTATCAETGLLINAELVEGAILDAGKKWREEWGATAACTMRLCEPWFNTGRVVIADSWFGSLKTAVGLLQNGLYSVMNVKGTRKGFPGKELREKVSVRGDHAHFKVVLPDF